MGRAKEILVKSIASKPANDFIKKWHYSGKVVGNSQLHFGCFLGDRLHGVLSFGCPLDKSKVLGIVEGTKWSEMVELNRMALDPFLPKNSESRCLAICLRLIRQHCPHVKWVLSFADGTRCGDGTIYRASGFHLIGIKKNASIIKLENGTIASNITFHTGQHVIRNSGKVRPPPHEVLKGFQLKYIYFLDPAYKQRLTVPILPFSEIERVGAKMYKGEKLCAESV